MIRDIDTVRTHSKSSTIFVALDVEGQEGLGVGVHSIGLAVLSSTDPPHGTAFDAWPWKDVMLDDALQSYKIESASLKVAGRVPPGSQKRPPERFRYGSVVSVPVDELEGYIRRCIQAAQEVYYLNQAAQEEQPNIVLVTWGASSEMHAMMNLFPGLLSILDAWVDLADVSTGMTGVSSPSALNDAPPAIGFTGRRVTLQGPGDFSYGHHDPGMDATRTAALLAGFLACPTERLDIPRYNKGRWRRKQTNKRPARETHPFAIMIRSEDGSPVPASMCTASRLESFFTTRSVVPVALAVCPPSKQPKEKTHGWVALDSLSAMQSLVSQFNGLEVDGKRLHLRIDGPNGKPSRRGTQWPGPKNLEAFES
ncbi:hypothetical protein B0T16DRAFT_459594 [Cercophora newfieldiana]|uniref:Uncharacterized protein n=1 Tax=Cercophora newfieldiana TaxID=92897 RepID=A0AA39Y233_9PEZI|nr:hypothetical protein B0T16DRAFT_459594 [Cercophora newfieldiana]